MLIRWLAWMYSVLILFHDRKLRECYGEDMLAVFREQVDESLRAEGLVGALRDTGRAYGEVATVALPARLRSDAVVVVSLTVVLSIATWMGLCKVLLDPDVLNPFLRKVGLQC